MASGAEVGGDRAVKQHEVRTLPVYADLVSGVSV
jgi:hypothetical protein